MLLLIDNYDSFTYNLYHYFQEIGATIKVVRNDAITIPEIRTSNYEGIILSPGPCSPTEAGICLDVIIQLGGQIPIFGVCLGHQAIGQAFGGEVVRGPKPMHAKITLIHHTESRLFKGIPESFKATRYHSLVVKKETLPSVLKVTATSDDGIIQALEHTSLPIYGVQFHPESITSEYGHDILRNFYQICKEFA